MIPNYCTECGEKLYLKELDKEGLVSFCPKCQKYQFPKFNVAISMIVFHNDEILLIKQYGNPFYILVAGYVNIKESAEEALERELMEELNLKPSRIEFNQTSYYEKSDTLMINFAVYVDDIESLKINEEIDSYKWFTIEEAKTNIKENSLAKKFLMEYLSKND